MLEIIIGILVKLLVDFLIDLFKKWFKKTNSVLPAADLESYRERFLGKVRWRVWLGPRRVELADRAFSLALANYRKAEYAGSIVYLSSRMQAEKIAALTTHGINLELLNQP